MDLDGRAGGKELGAVEGKETIISLHSLHFVRGKKTSTLNQLKGRTQNKHKGWYGCGQRDPHTLLT